MLFRCVELVSHMKKVERMLATYAAEEQVENTGLIHINDFSGMSLSFQL